MTAQRHTMEPVALGDHPLIESLFIDLKSIEKVAAIQLRRTRQRLVGPHRDERLEFGDIARHESFIETEKIVLFDQNLFICRELRELFAQRGKRLPQALSRLIGPGAAPQQRGDLPARPALSR